ncbi:MAG: glycosyltransferase family A protein, partial [Candidatus Paceibacterota bacterium]
MNFSVIIPTYKREKDLKICLDSILTQSKLPDEVLIIDDDILPSNFIGKKQQEFKNKNVELIYYKKDHSKNSRGSSESRNLGIELSSNKIFFILDDDLILDNDFFEKIMKVWEENNNRNLIGVGGLIKNNRGKYNLEKVYNKSFC